MPQSSFLPEDYIAQRAERRSSLMSLTLFVVVMSAVVGAFFVTNRQWTMVKQEQRNINVMYTDAAKHIEELEQLEQQKTQLVERAEVASALVERIPRSVLLAELINRMPDSVSLQEFDLKSEKEKVKRPSRNSQVKSILDKNGPEHVTLPSGKKPTKEQEATERTVEVPKFQVTVALTGVAPSDQAVANYLTNLGQCTLLKDVDLKYTKDYKVNDQSMRTFRIEATLDPTADAKQFQPLKLKRTLRDPMGNTMEFQSYDPDMVKVDLSGSNANKQKKNDQDKPAAKPAVGPTTSGSDGDKGRSQDHADREPEPGDSSNSNEGGQ